jgi:hypothetical protein
MMANDLDDITEMAAGIRDIFENALRSSLGGTETNDACLYAAMLLSSALAKFSGARAIVCGGGPPMDGGIYDPSGVCRGHYWVEGISASGQPFIADVSADQFGYDKIVVLTEDAGRHRYTRGNAALIAAHVAQECHALAMEQGV